MGPNYRDVLDAALQLSAEDRGIIAERLLETLSPVDAELSEDDIAVELERRTEIESTGNVWPSDAKAGSSIPVKASRKKSVSKVRAPAEGKHKTASAARQPAPTRAKPAPNAKRLPAATTKALRELEAGELTRHTDADDLFRKLGIKLDKA
jgi:hypothetical protein